MAPRSDRSPKTSTSAGRLRAWQCDESVAAIAAQDFDLGKYEHVSKCASCHGETGTGDGVMRKRLVTPPSDLTTLTKRSGGVFPNQLVWLTIDGRTEKRFGAYGSREMPDWGSE